MGVNTSGASAVVSGTTGGGGGGGGQPSSSLNRMVDVSGFVRGTGRTYECGDATVGTGAVDEPFSAFLAVVPGVFPSAEEDATLPEFGKISADFGWYFTRQGAFEARESVSWFWGACAVDQFVGNAYTIPAADATDRVYLLGLLYVPGGEVGALHFTVNGEVVATKPCTFAPELDESLVLGALTDGEPTLESPDGIVGAAWHGAELGADVFDAVSALWREFRRSGSLEGALTVVLGSAPAASWEASQLVGLPPASATPVPPTTWANGGTLGAAANLAWAGDAAPLAARLNANPDFSGISSTGLTPGQEREFPFYVSTDGLGPSGVELTEELHIKPIEPANAILLRGGDDGGSSGLVGGVSTDPSVLPGGTDSCGTVLGLPPDTEGPGFGGPSVMRGGVRISSDGSEVALGGALNIGGGQIQEFGAPFNRGGAVFLSAGTGQGATSSGGQLYCVGGIGSVGDGNVAGGAELASGFVTNDVGAACGDTVVGLNSAPGILPSDGGMVVRGSDGVIQLRKHELGNPGDGQTTGSLQLMSLAATEEAMLPIPAEGMLHYSPDVTVVSPRFAGFRGFSAGAFKLMARGYQATFTNADPVGGVLSVTHDLGTLACIVAVYDPSGVMLTAPLDYTVVQTDPNTSELTFGPLANGDFLVTVIGF